MTTMLPYDVCEVVDEELADLPPHRRETFDLRLARWWADLRAGIEDIHPDGDLLPRSPVIGYDRASVIAHHAIDHGLTLKEAALANGVSKDLYDRVVDPLALTRGGSADVPAGKR